MKTSLFDYHLPRERIAQTPARPRDSSRLLVYDRQLDRLRHDHFYNLPKYLRPGDVLVFNDTKVFPARLYGKKETGGAVEVFLLRPIKGATWEVLIGGKVRRIGMKLHFKLGLSCKVVKMLEAGVWQVRFNQSPGQVVALANKIGTAPTPPYVKKLTKLSDYQTVYAKNVGSVAAPTAGFHFTRRLLARLKKQGVQFEFVTLHVGFGTFQPVKVDDIAQHQMHAEYAEVSSATCTRLERAKQEGRRIIAVGTTSVRVLETVFRNYLGGRRVLSLRRDLVRARALIYPRGGFKGWINTFIYPGYRFKMIDAMITNFHLPKSTLLMLVSAFLMQRSRARPWAGARKAIESLLHIYKEAIKKQYRFYSFGDGMMII